MPEDAAEKIKQLREQMAKVRELSERIVEHPEILDDWTPAQKAWIAEHYELIIFQLKRIQKDIERALSQREHAEFEAYASLADEMNDPDVPGMNEDDWDQDAVSKAKAYAKRHGLRWPPGTGDFDRLYEEHE